MSIPAHLRLVTAAEFAARRSPVHGRSRATRRAFGSGNAVGPNRAAFEFYPTPPEATRALLSLESFDGPIWEPACGKGHISRVLEDHTYSVVSTDLADWGYGLSGRDFLAERKPLAKHIVTNPPYGRGLADAFAKHAIALTRETRGTVAMLMNVAGLCHPLRHDFYVSHPPALIYCLDDCTCWPYGDPQRATRTIGQQRYCWIVWKHGHLGPTVLRWLRTAPFR